MRYIFILLVVLLASQALAHEVQPPPRAESCAAMKWLNSELTRLPVVIIGSPIFRMHLEEFAKSAGDECEAYQAQGIGWAGIDAEMDAAIERAAKKADERLLK